MLEIKNISKSFAEHKVLNHVSLTVQSGEVYGLIGANGAGKTTLMNIVSQILLPDEGEVFIEGKKLHSMNDLNGNIGYMLDIPSMFEFMTAYEYFEFLSSPLNKSKEEIKEISDRLLKEVSLSGVGNKRIKAFSRGMKQRMGIAAALISDPKVILMDEPSSALDPQGRFEVLQIIEKLKKQGKTIVLSTHILNDVEKICDKIGFLVNGTIALEDTLENLLLRFRQDIFVVQAENKEAIDFAIARAQKSKSYLSHTLKNLSAEISFLPNQKEEMFASIITNATGIQSIAVKNSSIEQIFFSLGKGGKS